MDLSSIIHSFKIEGDIVAIRKINTGYINTSYKLETSKASYVLQKINHKIFKEVDKLSENIHRVTTHIQTKTKKEKLNEVLHVIDAQDGKGYYQDLNGNFWRVFNFILGSKTIETLATKKQAKSMGKAFGNYHELLSDLPEPPLFEILPDFHHTPLRIEQFKRAIEENSDKRLSNARNEVNYLLDLSPEMSELITLAEKGSLPLRTIHQDAKLTNILFDIDDNAISVIDLDTTMPGYLAYDFGDAVRTGMNKASEEEKNLSKVSLNIELFRAFVEGYAHSTKHFILKEEIKSLVLGVKVITYEQAIRFFTDYLNGDVYYHTEYGEQNLVRAKVQIAFLKDVIENFSLMNDLVVSIYRRSF